MSEYVTPEAVLKLGETDPEYAEYLKSSPTYASPWDDVPRMRAELAALRSRSVGQSMGKMQTVPMRDGFQHNVLCFGKPASASVEFSPLILLVHGGGFIVGAKEDMGMLAETISSAFAAVVICVSYRLAPEWKFPAAPNDVYDTLVWAASNATLLGASPEKAGFIIGGVSAGANLAAVAAQKAVAASLSPSLTGVYLSIPVLLHEDIVPGEYRSVFLSREQNRAAAILDAEGLSYVSQYYCYDPHSADFSPFNESSEAQQAMPPVYFQVAGQDPLRDDGLIYERFLRAKGVKTKLDVYPGVPHGFSEMLPHLIISQKANNDTLSGFRWLLLLS